MMPTTRFTTTCHIHCHGHVVRYQTIPLYYKNSEMKKGCIVKVRQMKSIQQTHTHTHMYSNVHKWDSSSVFVLLTSFLLKKNISIFFFFFFFFILYSFLSSFPPFLTTWGIANWQQGPPPAHVFGFPLPSSCVRCTTGLFVIDFVVISFSIFSYFVLCECVCLCWMIPGHTCIMYSVLPFPSLPFSPSFGGSWT